MPIKNRTHFKEEGNLPLDSRGVPLEAGILLATSFPSPGSVYPSTQQTESLTVVLGNEIPEKFSKGD